MLLTRSSPALLCAAFCLGCAGAKPEGGEIKSDPSALDFGEVALNQSAERSTNLTVVGTQAVAISALDITGANASAYEITTVPQRVQPGVPSLLGVRFYAGSAPGSAEADIVLTTDSAATPTVTIHLTGTAVDPHGGPYTHSSWSAWSTCSSTCGSGNQARARSCLNRSAETVNCSLCGGACSETQSCAADSGCVGATYGAWGSWGPCTSSMRSRTRACNVGATAVDCSACGGECTQSEACTVSCSSHGANIGYCSPTAPGDKAACDAIVQQRKTACLAESCQWPGPSECTIGGSASSPSCYGATVTCI